MKKLLVVLAVLAFAGVWGAQVWARGPHHGQGPYSGVTFEQRQKFMEETASVRKSLWEKQNELNVLLTKPESDPAQIGTLQKEIYGLQEQLRAKADSAGFGCPFGGPGMGGRGQMYGRGPGKCGFGMGCGWGR